MKLPKVISDVMRELESKSNFDLCAVLTLIVLLQTGPSDGLIRFFLAGLAIIGLTLESCRRNAGFWFLISGFYLAGIFVNWWKLDNHIWLIGYWCFATYLSLSVPNFQRENCLELNGRWMIVGCMGFAVAWKIISPDYLTGDFFTHALLTDSRFFGVTALLTDLDVETLLENERILIESGSLKNEAILHSHKTISIISMVLTFWTILIEFFIAVAFLLPESNLFRTARITLLSLFVATTYLVAPVSGFGWILTILALSTAKTWRLRLICLCFFVLIQVYRMPYDEVLRVFGWLT